ncbi:MAG TPA: hypothetical protein VJM53_04390 [Burkholderiales bacterium]|jgi:hypothetical protein|nr:hypothetical protein [Burkholderiales bacterium]
MSARRTLGQVFRWPILLAILSAAGLLSALIGNDFYDAISWALLAAPVSAGIYYWFVR